MSIPSLTFLFNRLFRYFAVTSKTYLMAMFNHEMLKFVICLGVIADPVLFLLEGQELRLV